MGAGHRPPNPVAGAPVPERRTVMLAARVTQAECAAWQEKAAAGVSPSELPRHAMARTRTWTAPARAVERERTRQIARWANTYKAAASPHNASWILDILVPGRDHLRRAFPAAHRGRKRLLAVGGG